MDVGLLLLPVASSSGGGSDAASSFSGRLPALAAGELRARKGRRAAARPAPPSGPKRGRATARSPRSRAALGDGTARRRPAASSAEAGAAPAALWAWEAGALSSTIEAARRESVLRRRRAALEEGGLACAAQDWAQGIALYRAGLGAEPAAAGQPLGNELRAALRAAESAQAAAQEEARQQVAQYRAKAQEETAVHKYEAAAVAYKDAQAAAVNDEQLAKKLELELERVLTTIKARDAARAQARGLLEQGKALRLSRDWAGAIAACGAALDQEAIFEDDRLGRELRDTLGACRAELWARDAARAKARRACRFGNSWLALGECEASAASFASGLQFVAQAQDESLGSELRLGQWHAEAQGRLMLGRSAEGNREWEVAIERFGEGLRHEPELQAAGLLDVLHSLREGIRVCEQSLAAREAARTLAAEESRKGEAAMEAGDLPAATAAFAAAAAADVQDAAVSAHAAGLLRQAETALRNQQEVRSRAASYAAEAEQAARAHDYEAAIRLFRSALELDVCEPRLSESYSLGVSRACDNLRQQTAQRERARAALSSAERAMEVQNWDGAITSLRFGLAEEETHDPLLTAALNKALRAAEGEVAVRDGNRELAARLSAQAREDTRARGFDAAIRAYKEALDLDLQDEELTGRLWKGIEATEVARRAWAEEQAAQRERAQASLSTAERAMEIQNWESAITSLRLGLCEKDTDDAALTALLQETLVSAEAAMRARDENRALAARLAAQAHEDHGRRDYESAEAKYAEAVLLDIQDEETSRRLQRSKEVTETALRAQQQARNQAVAHRQHARDAVAARRYEDGVECLAAAIREDVNDPGLSEELAAELESVDTKIVERDAARNVGSEFTTRLIDAALPVAARTIAQQLCQEGHQLMIRKDFGRAVRCYEAAVALDVDDAVLATSLKDALAAVSAPLRSPFFCVQRLSSHRRPV